MGKLKEERDVLCNRITKRLERILAWKGLTVDEVTTEYGWDPNRIKRQMKGRIRYNLEDMVILANTFGISVEYFAGEVRDDEEERLDLVIMFSELSEEHKKDIIELIQSDNIPEESKRLMAKYEAEADEK